MKLEMVLRYLPENASLTTQLFSEVLVKIGVIFLSSCEANPSKCIQKPAQRRWIMEPYQFVEHWGYVMKGLLLFIKKLMELPAIISIRESVEVIIT